MRLLPAILLVFCTSLFAQAPAGAVKTFKLDTPLPSPSRGPLMTDAFSSGASTSTANTAPTSLPAAPEGLPPIPASVAPAVDGPTEPLSKEGTPEVSAAPNPPAPVKVYETLSQAAADGVNPLAPQLPQTAPAPVPQAAGFDWGRWVRANGTTAALGALLAALVGVAVWLRRRNRED